MRGRKEETVEVGRLEKKKSGAWKVCKESKRISKGRVKRITDGGKGLEILGMAEAEETIKVRGVAQKKDGKRVFVAKRGPKSLSWDEG